MTALRRPVPVSTACATMTPAVFMWLTWSIVQPPAGSVTWIVRPAFQRKIAWAAAFSQGSQFLAHEFR